tara:strand:+ start:6153 stop:6422 length:270 start_codon:yes stop_codon:yes gene_type:complete
MSASKEELEALRRIEELLAKDPDAEAPTQQVEQAEAQPQQELPVNPDAIAEAEAATEQTTNQLATISATLDALLVEVQAVSNALQSMVE